MVLNPMIKVLLTSKRFSVLVLCKRRQQILLFIRLQFKLVLLKSSYLLHFKICKILHFRYDVHEKRIGQIAKEMGFDHVSLSSDVMPMVRIVPRGYTGTS